MLRTQIQLSEEQNERLKEIARARKESIAAVIREAIDQFLLARKPARVTLYRKAIEVVGKYEAGVSDASVNHDRYLDESYRQ